MRCGAWAASAQSVKLLRTIAPNLKHLPKEIIAKLRLLILALYSGLMEPL
jgi:hypothetical protein